MSRCTHRPRQSLTNEPLLLNTERLHRVDSSKLPAGAGVSFGHCRTDMGICMGHPACADTACPGHPGVCPDTPASQGGDKSPAHDVRWLSWSLAGYIVAVALCIAAALQWAAR